MENNQSQPSFREKVLKDIETENVQVYSRAHFTIRMITLVVVAVLVFLISVFLFDVVLAGLRVSGRASLLNFGPRGFLSFLRFFPWMLLVLDLALLVILEWLVRNFRFGYRVPVLYLLVGLLALAFSISLFIDRGTGINDALLRGARAHHLPPPFADLYDRARHPPGLGEGICKCTITAIRGTMITARDIDTTSTLTVNVVVPPEYAGTLPFKVGDQVLIAGNVSPSGTIQAFGIRLLVKDELDPVYH